MSRIKLEQCDPKFRARVLKQVREEDEAKLLHYPLRVVKHKDGTMEWRDDDPKQKSTLKQDKKPPLNGLETQVLRRLQYEQPEATFHAQSLRWLLANGAWYKPDLWSLSGGRLRCWEAKCIRGKGAKKGLLAVKVAAHQYPEVDFWLVTKEKGAPLRFERILP